jgi:hypothetical protein
MAQITWRNIDAPNLGSAISGVESAARLLNTGMANFKGIADNRKESAADNIDDLNKQGQADILKQMAAFKNPDDLAAAISSGALDVAMAGMTGDGQIAAQAQIAEKGDTLLDQSIKRKDQDLRSQEIDIKRDEFALNKRQTEQSMRQQSIIFERQQKDLALAEEIMTSTDYYALNQQLMSKQEEIRTSDQFAYAFNEKGQFDINKLFAEDAEAYALMLQELEVNHTEREATARKLATQISDPNQRQQVLEYINAGAELMTEGSALDQAAKTQRLASYEKENGLTNNLFVRADKEAEANPDTAVLDRLLSDSEFMSSLEDSDGDIKGHIKDMLEGITGADTFTYNGTEVPITASIVKLAVKLTKDNGDFNPLNDSAEDFLSKTIGKFVGEDPEAATQREEYDKYRNFKADMKAKYSFNHGDRIADDVRKANQRVRNLEIEATDRANANQRALTESLEKLKDDETTEAKNVSLEEGGNDLLDKINAMPTYGDSPTPAKNYELNSFFEKLYDKEFGETLPSGSRGAVANSKARREEQNKRRNEFVKNMREVNKVGGSMAVQRQLEKLKQGL